ncbi:uncharacterized protein C3orf38 homolog isoform X2 [Pseudophryne corroboree]|uniref:uncharacterized protein C3orf38 homolog isoform X2 n=1 Tax=Pseudophryne corroboree TaxID=495146 RepID=UPI003081775C
MVTAPPPAVSAEVYSRRSQGRSVSAAMSGLSGREKECCRRLLALLDTQDLISIAETVTNRMIHVLSREEAIDAILSYSKDATELLKRRKVHRSVIFKYLDEEKISVLPSWEKHQLIQCALDHWRVPGVQKDSPPGQKVEKEDQSHLDSLDCKLLGEQFCTWFYSLLNSQNPSLGQERGDWGPQHFWENAILRFSYRTREQAMEEHSGSQMTSLRLLSLTRDERLIFNPNLDSKGLKCVTSSHGLVVVAVAGTIHRGNACLGIFEQIFGLIRCPIGNNWKIKHVDLKILAQTALGCEESQRLPSISYNTGELEVYYKSDR